MALAGLDRHKWLDDGVLSDAEEALVAQRFRDLEANPHASVPWEEAEPRLVAPFER